MTERIFSPFGVIKRPKWREFKAKDKQLFNTIQPELWALVDRELQRQCETGQSTVCLEVALGGWTWIWWCDHLQSRHQGQSPLRSSVLMRMGCWQTEHCVWYKAGRRKPSKGLRYRKREHQESPAILYKEADCGTALPIKHRGHIKDGLS